MPESVKARPVDPYATRIPTRNKPFKTHRTLGQVKSALKLHLVPDSYRGPRGYTEYSDDGYYTVGMTVFRLDPEQGEYEPWITIAKGDRRSKHSELMPQCAQPASQPTDEQERAIAISKVRGLRDWTCECHGEPHKPWCLAEAKKTLLTRLGADQ